MGQLCKYLKYVYIVGNDTKYIVAVVPIFAFPCQQWLRELSTMLRYTYIVVFKLVLCLC